MVKLDTNVLSSIMTFLEPCLDKIEVETFSEVGTDLKRVWVSLVALLPMVQSTNRRLQRGNVSRFRSFDFVTGQLCKKTLYHPL